MVVTHCSHIVQTGKTGITKAELEYYKPVFEAHGIKLEIPHELKPLKIIYRVSDGYQFIREGDVYYGELDIHKMQGYTFSMLNDPYSFTSNPDEVEKR